MSQTTVRYSDKVVIIHFEINWNKKKKLY